MSHWNIFHGDAMAILRGLPAERYQTCVTSPPYWGLRSYLPADHVDKAAELGGEATPEEYVARLVAVFREVRRVLRSDGTLWLNLGDSYVQDGRRGAVGDESTLAGTRHAAAESRKAQAERPITVPAGLKRKDLVGIPWRVAFALQADGWYLRSDVIWHKPNPLPESVTDRPTKSHEYFFLFSKKDTYFYDRVAIMEAATGRGNGAKPTDKYPASYAAGDETHRTKELHRIKAALTRNRRSVWTVATHPYDEAHFATFPPKLIQPAIMAGTSEKGACASCGAAWVRVVESEEVEPDGTYDGKHAGDVRSVVRKGGNGTTRPQDGAQRLQARAKAARAAGGDHSNPFAAPVTVGWEAGCDCAEVAPVDVVPCRVLDPFSGAGTTVMVSRALGRAADGIELSAEYVAQSLRRIEDDQPLFNGRAG